MAIQISIDTKALQREVQVKYAEVALTPTKGFHFHTGRPLAERLAYPKEVLDTLPEGCVESFAGVGNPFSLGAIRPGETVVDVGSGAGFDSLVAGSMVGETGNVIGVDMTPEMLRKARRNARRMRASNVSFRKDLVEKLPISNRSADVVISNGGHQPGAGQGSSPEGDSQCAQARRAALSVGHRGAQAGARRRQGGDRPLD